MFSSMAWSLLLAVYLAGVVVPRAFCVLAGRRCPHCAAGRLWFGGLADNPWRSLRSWWHCETCRATLCEASWGRLQPDSNLMPEQPAIAPASAE
jgi:hypothetical protein